MNKREASVFLNVSEKTLERLVKRGELSARFEKGRTRDVIIFDDDELARFKEQRESAKHVPAIVKPDVSPVQSLILPIPTNTENLDRQNQTDQFSQFTSALESLAEAQKMGVLYQKPTLTLPECALISGLSVTLLERAVREGNLKTLPGHRGAKVIRRKDLDLFIESL